ncbi:hypothetical protein RQP46_008315 [Phenoliferia psychrophenolica]
MCLWTRSQLRSQINSQIGIELRSILPKSAPAAGPANLTHLPTPRALPPSSSFLASELARVESRRPIPAGEGLDTSRYAMLPPTGKAETSVEAWQAAYDSSLAQLEHQRLRQMNGTILAGGLGANAWRIQNFSLENTLQKVDNEGEEVRKEVEEVNRERKRGQEKGGEVLSRMEKKWTELVSSNLQLEIGCMAMEHEVAALHARHSELKARLQTA